MFAPRHLMLLGFILAGVIAGAPAAFAQTGSGGDREIAPFVIIPQQRTYSTQVVPTGLRLTTVSATIDIVEQVATTTLEIEINNPSADQLEAELIVPVPNGAAVRHFSIDGAGGETAAILLPGPEARRLYQSIVSKMQDPGLLEFIGFNLIRSSVFPVSPNATQTLTLAYEQILTSDGDRIDYVLPRSDALAGSSVAWNIWTTIRSERPISAVYSPSHELQTSRSVERVTASVPADKAGPGTFRLSYLLEREGLATTVLTYPDEEAGGGYFLVLAGLPEPEAEATRARQKREVIVVLDRSGSMRGEKLEQARGAAIQVLEGLEPGEAFNIIDYSESVSMFAERPVVKDGQSLADARAYLGLIGAGGGTDIHAALSTAVTQTPTEGMLSMVIFLTDGLPTAGNTSEVDIREHTQAENVHDRRIFTFGVGFDVNAPLLDRIAQSSRAASINVLPGQDIEVAVTTVFRRLAGPVLSLPRITAVDADGNPSTRVVRELMPTSLPDLFDGDQLVTLGRYLGQDPVRLSIEGERDGATRSFGFEFDPADAMVRNAFVPRLWASRKIANLIDEVRQSGANGDAPGGQQSVSGSTANEELVEEIVRLSMKFGILTEYTAFLAQQPESAQTGAAAFDYGFACSTTLSNLEDKAVKERWGIGAVSQSLNIKEGQVQACVNPSNEWLDASMNRVSIMTVQQLGDQTLFRRGERWVDARIVSRENEDLATPQKVVEFGSEEYFALAGTLAATGRSALMAIPGEVYLIVNGEAVLVSNPTKPIDDGC